MFFLFGRYVFRVKKACNRSATCLIPGYRQVTSRTTSTEQFTLISVNLPTACSRTLNDWRYSELENKS